MAINKGYLTCDRSSNGDEVITPRYAVEPLIKYLKINNCKKIWCPFDKEHSQYTRVLRANGFEVIATGGCDFFMIPKLNCDCIVSNPPFSKKDEILKKCYEMGISFALLLPQNSLQSKERTKMFIEKGLEYLGFDSRICFYTRSKVKIEDEWIYKWTPEDLKEIKVGNHFASGYFCWKLLPKELIFEKLELIQEPYCENYTEMAEELNKGE